MGKLKSSLDFLRMTNLKKPRNGLGLSDTIVSKKIEMFFLPSVE